MELSVEVPQQCFTNFFTSIENPGKMATKLDTLRCNWLERKQLLDPWPAVVVLRGDCSLTLYCGSVFTETCDLCVRESASFSTG